MPAPAAIATVITELPPTAITLTTILVRATPPLMEFSPQELSPTSESGPIMRGETKDVMRLAQADRRVRGCLEDWRFRTFLTEVKPCAFDLIVFHRPVLMEWR